GLAALVLPLGDAHARTPPDEEGHPGVLRHPARAGAQLWPGAQRQCRAAGAVGGEGAATGAAPGRARRTGQAAPGTRHFVAVNAWTAARPTAGSSVKKPSMPARR